jgi:hypothetical protein
VEQDDALVWDTTAVRRPAGHAVYSHPQADYLFSVNDVGDVFCQSCRASAEPERDQQRRALLQLWSTEQWAAWRRQCHRPPEDMGPDEAAEEAEAEEAEPRSLGMYW